MDIGGLGDTTGSHDHASNHDDTHDHHDKSQQQHQQSQRQQQLGEQQQGEPWDEYCGTCNTDWNLDALKGKGKGEDRECFHCGRRGHLKADCYFKHLPQDQTPMGYHKAVVANGIFPAKGGQRTKGGQRRVLEMR